MKKFLKGDLIYGKVIKEIGEVTENEFDGFYRVKWPSHDRICRDRVRNSHHVCKYCRTADCITMKKEE